VRWDCFGEVTPSISRLYHVQIACLQHPAFNSANRPRKDRSFTPCEIGQSDRTNVCLVRSAILKLADTQSLGEIATTNQKILQNLFLDPAQTHPKSTKSGAKVVSLIHMIKVNISLDRESQGLSTLPSRVPFLGSFSSPFFANTLVLPRNLVSVPGQPR